MTDLLVLHDLGSAGGAPWRDAFAAWPGSVAAPDLPGHGAAPMPTGGHHEIGDAVFAVAPLLADRDRPQPVVVGVGANGYAARLLALGGRASALVLVDGLGGPWLDVRARTAALRAVRREILATPAALEPHVGAGPDPRAALVPTSSDRDHVVRTCVAITVPTVLVETPGSPTPDADALCRSFPDATMTRVGDGMPGTVVRAVVEWWAAR